MRVYLLEVVGDPLVRDVPLAVVARRDLGEALVTKQRAAVEELLDPRPLGLRRRLDVQRDRQRGPTAVAGVLVLALDDRLVVVVQSAGHYARPGAQRAGHGELGKDRLADELALVFELAEEFGQILLHLEGDDLLLLG